MGCHQTALSLGKAIRLIKPVTVCQACGTTVRKRGGWGELAAVLLFLLVISYPWATGEGFTGAWIVVGAVLFASYMEWWSWRSVVWDPEDTTEAA
jgi:hypothetical protein